MPRTENDLDLDIRNYALADLERLFSLPTRRKRDGALAYSEADLDLREAQIRTQFTDSGVVDRRFAADFVAFLAEAKRALAAACAREAPDKTPSSVPPTWRLDPRDIPPSRSAAPRTDELAPTTRADFIHTAPGDFFAGDLNPLAKRVVARHVCIDSVFRDNYLATRASDFTAVLPTPLSKIVSLRVAAAELPESYVALSSAARNQEFSVFIFNAPDLSDTQHTVVVPDGNYAPADMAAYLSAQFAARGGGLEYLLMEIDAPTGRAVVRARATDETGGPSALGTPNFHFVLDFTLADAPDRALHRNLGWAMGFRHKWYTVRADSVARVNFESYNCAVTSDCAVDLRGARYVYVEIDDFHNNYTTNAMTAASGAAGAHIGKNVLARIPLRSRGDAAIAEGVGARGDDRVSVFAAREYFGPVSIEKLRVRLLDRAGDVLDLAGGDIAIVLELKQLYAQ